MSSLLPGRRRLTDTIWGRIALALLAAVLYGGIGAFAYKAMNTPDLRTSRDPTEDAVFLCGFIAIILAIVQYDRLGGVIVMTACGLVVGSCISPCVSTGAVNRVAAIRDGNWMLFTPFGLCLGAFLGTVLGQNLVEIRQAINRVNSSSLRLTRDGCKGAHS